MSALDRDGERCVVALVARIARQFSEGVSWIQREYPEVLDEAMQERMKRELLAQLEFKPYVPKPAKEEWTKQ